MKGRDLLQGLGYVEDKLIHAAQEPLVQGQISEQERQWEREYHGEQEYHSGQVHRSEKADYSGQREGRGKRVFLGFVLPAAAAVGIITVTLSFWTSSPAGLPEDSANIASEKEESI